MLIELLCSLNCNVIIPLKNNKFPPYKANLEVLSITPQNLSCQGETICLDALVSMAKLKEFYGMLVFIFQGLK